MGKFQSNSRRNIKERCLIYLGGKKCAGCGVSHLSPRAYDFNHVRGIKEFNVSQMIGKGLSFQEIKDELDKCEVLCANCHREFHNRW